VALSWRLYLVFATYAPTVLSIFGSRFQEGQAALMILSLAMLVNLGTGNVDTVLLMGGRSSWNLFNSAGGVILNVGLNLMLIPRYGIAGSALAWAATIAFTNLAAVFEVRTFMGLRPFGSGYLRVALDAVACWGGLGLLFRAVLGEGGVALLAYVVVAGAIWLALLWRWRGILRLAELRGAL